MVTGGAVKELLVVDSNLCRFCFLASLSHFLVNIFLLSFAEKELVTCWVH